MELKWGVCRHGMGGMVDRKESEHHHRESDILLQTFKDKHLESIEIFNIYV